MRMKLIPLIASLLALPIAACAQTTQPDKPFVMGEAKLPAGFPAPGKVDEIVIKNYPAYRAARVSSDAGQNRMFNTLFNHIQSNDIKMTAPVEMTYEAGEKTPATQPAAMSFLYAEPTLGQPGKTGDVDVIDLPAASYVSIGVRGSYTPERFAESLKKLHDWLSVNPTYAIAGSPRYLGYNSPFVPPPMRYGEVQIQVKAVEQK